MAFNIDNNLNLTGRVETQDMNKGLFKNSDGSRKLRFTLAVSDSYNDRAGNPSKQDIPVEAFIPASMVKTDQYGNETYGIYSTIRTGDLISIAGHLMDNNYLGKDGKMVYGGIIVRIDTLKHRESRSVSEARAQQKSTQS